MSAAPLTREQVLSLLPHRDPFRFIDEILELDDQHIVATHRFRPEADFYRGHFPDRPITPGVILIESMAQAGVVAHGIYLLSREAGADEAGKLLTLFTEASVEFSCVVNPGDRVTVRGEKEFFRRRKLRSRVEMHLEDGRLACSGLLSGVGVFK